MPDWTKEKRPDSCMNGVRPCNCLRCMDHINSSTFASAGRPTCIASMLLILGFLAFVPGEFLSIQQLGILNAFVLTVSLAVDLTLTPIILRLAPALKASAPDIRKEDSKP